MCNKDWPERDVASFFVRALERDWDCWRREIRRDWRWGVEESALIVVEASVLALEVMSPE